MTNGLGQGRS